MNKMLHGAISARLGVAFAVLVLLLLACVAFGISRLGALNDGMQSFMTDEVQAVGTSKLPGGRRDGVAFAA